MIIKFLKKYFIYILIALTNVIIGYLFQKSYRVVYAPIDVLVLSIICYKCTTLLKNRYNILISRFWILFFFLGLLNINSVIVYDTTWLVDIHGASMLYFFDILIFSLALLFYEKGKSLKIIREKKFESIIKSKIFVAFVIIFPFLFIATLYKSVGFLPILSGASFVDEMYNYDYGPLYGYKFLCAYGFLVLIYFFKTNRYKYLCLIGALLLLFIVSVDGKRFMLFVILLAYLPLNEYLNKAKDPNYKASYKSLILISSGILVIYIAILALRLGNNNLNDWVTLFVSKIPFGVEYKDYAYSFEKITPEALKDYDFLASNIGAFFNGNLLDFFGFNKESLTHQGSAYIWMKIYNIDFGIRTGIVSEIYFGYGILGSFLMIPLAYFVNRTSSFLLNPKSLFNLFQHAIIYALFVLIINGQATVFFGCLSLMFYMYLFKLFIFRVLKRRN